MIEKGSWWNGLTAAMVSEDSDHDTGSDNEQVNLKQRQQMAITSEWTWNKEGR